MNRRKLKISGSIFSAILLVFICNNVRAQESDFLMGDGLPDDDASESVSTFLPDLTEPIDEKAKKKEKREEVEAKNTENLLVKSEEKNLQQPASPNATSVYNPTAPADINENPDPDNPLSFNFLYYIIQKFKFAEVVDK